LDSSTTATRSKSVDLAAIARHPIRIQALDVLTQRTASPTEIAHELRLRDVGKVAYHVRRLESLELVELVDERRVRGAVEHFFRARVLPLLTEEQFARLEPQHRTAFTTYTLQLIVASATRAVSAGSFDARPERALTRTPALVDETGWRELCDLHLNLHEETMRIREDSANRIAKDPGQPTINAMQAAMLFEEP
jgi:hypothetical protein